MWKMYGEQKDYVAVQQLKALKAQLLAAPQAQGKNLGQEQSIVRPARQHHLKGRPSPLKGRKISEAHRMKLTRPKTEEQKAALRVPKKNTQLMGKYERTPEIRAKMSEIAKGKLKTDETRAKMSKARLGAKNHAYRSYVFAAQHPVHGMFHGERALLHRMHPHLKMCQLRKLALGEHTTYKGWVLLQSAAK
ncbi:endonuclease protein [Stenotrophomonas phage vB_SmaS-DLP_6]|nr:endonuclease protein [Stenotrophomonas phage vB_SmaS-DLP_6]